MKNKRGIEPIIATVLLIVIVIAAVALVWTAVIPFIKNQMSQSQVCMQTTGLAIDDEWTCWSKNEKELQVKIVRDNKDYELTGLIFKFTDSEGTTNVNTSKKMGLELPGVLEEKVYKFDVSDMGFGTNWDKNIVSVAVAPIVKSGNSEKTCDVVATLNVDCCEIGGCQ